MSVVRCWMAPVALELEYEALCREEGNCLRDVKLRRTQMPPAPVLLVALHKSVEQHPGDVSAAPAIVYDKRKGSLPTHQETPCDIHESALRQLHGMRSF